MGVKATDNDFQESAMRKARVKFTSGITRVTRVTGMCQSGTKEQKLDRRRRKKMRRVGGGRKLREVKERQKGKGGMEGRNECREKAQPLIQCTRHIGKTRALTVRSSREEGSRNSRAEPKPPVRTHTQTRLRRDSWSILEARRAGHQRTEHTKMERKIPDFAGTWEMKTSENFEELLKKLGVNMMLRMIAVKAASKPLVEITQDGETLSIKTSTTVRTTHITFTVGQDFNEITVDGRPCTSHPRWETDSKISCEQTLQKGEGPKTSWTREITNDGKLILTMGADDVICSRVYERQ
ncbi:hypothetical protein F7725_018427 [Dissostichus mawsoni]|uniref:Cellular retinoic acid-binding protein 1 n=1 Tax=Dissostichus mawsoni TaxID=36200 RepID=A0A7J5XRJ4_DISMA|nr:hypothetical protein F7725_018427 [Dissostichus mawsoni]